MSDFTLRQATDKDLPVVYRSAARSLRSSPLYRDLPDDQWTEIINGLITRMTTAPWQLTIAHPTGYPDEIAGFALHRQTHHGKPVIGVLYVKTAYRCMGIGRQLLNHVTNGRTDFLVVLAQPKVLGMCRDRGYLPQLSPYFL